MIITNIYYILNITIILFLIGALGLVLNRKNILITIMSIECYQNKSVIVKDFTINCATYIIKVLTCKSHSAILVQQ